MALFEILNYEILQCDYKTIVNDIMGGEKK